MAIIIAYWLYVFFLTATFGIGLTTILKLRPINPFIIPFIGAFVISILAGVWAIFGNLSTLFELVLLVASFSSLIVNRKEGVAYFFSLKAKVSSLPLLLKGLLAIITAFALAQCASAPYILDNESYYIQTIKWLDTCGFVKGLANFHFFLGQNSGWHILQSAINLDGISPLFNDINGLFLLLGNAYAFDTLKSYYKTKQLLFLAVGIFPIFNVFLFQFISSPSPDLPIYILSLVVFAEFAAYYVKDVKEKTPILLLLLLVIFAVYIKVLAVFLLPFPLLLYAKNKSLLRKDLLAIGVLSTVTLAVFTIKNSVISGYPLYPLGILKLGTDWALPVELQDYLVDATKFYAFFLTPEEFEQMSFTQKILRWISLPKLHGLFNKVMLLLLILFPIIIRFKKMKTPYVVLYGASVLQLLFLWATSPQYRFFFGFLIILSCVIMASIVQRKRIIEGLLVLSTLVVAVPLFGSFSLKKLTNNQFEQDLSSFSLDYALVPHPSTKYTQATYKKNTLGNLTYYAPINIDFFWATGDCELPCIQQQQLEDFKDYFEQAPQLRTDKLEDGFKSVYFPYE